MCGLTIVSQEQMYPFCPGGTLLEILQSHGLMMKSPCAGKGICGKCKVKNIQGLVNAPTAEELNLLTDEELHKGIRLSCLVNPSGDLTIQLPDQKDLKHKILSHGYLPEFEINPIQPSARIFKIIEQLYQELILWNEK